VGYAVTVASTGVELHHPGNHNQVVKVLLQPIRRAESVAPFTFGRLSPPFGRERIALLD